jgi:hypothetical protein
MSDEELARALLLEETCDFCENKLCEHPGVLMTGDAWEERCSRKVRASSELRNREIAAVVKRQTR